MPLNEQAILVLQQESGTQDRGMSSYWKESLKDYDYQNQEFIGKSLPEGKGAKKTLLRSLMHHLLQYPYRRQGRVFNKFQSILDAAKKIHARRNNQMALGTLRQVLALALLQHEARLFQGSEPIVVIGDGFGVMSSLLLSTVPRSTKKIVVINLTLNLLIDAVFIRKSVPDATFALAKTEEEYREVLKDTGIQAILVQADYANLIRHDAIGLAINISSMQEMDPLIVAQYFDILRSSTNENTFFYCCNRLEKVLPDGTVSRFHNYPWHPQDILCVDDLCPWHQTYYSLKFPFYHPYDGPSQHRLALLHKRT